MIGKICQGGVMMGEFCKVIRIFMGSPSDLAQERTRFRKIVADVNKIKANSMGIELKPLDWGDTLPGKGRPQGLINDVVKTSDLIVLLLWKRWGTSTEEYSSGFEEEYELAKSMNEKTKGKPEIWLYFRDVPKDMLADPDEQLKHVLDFKTKIEKEQRFLYHAYKNRNDWEKSLKDHLGRWLDKTEENINKLKLIQRVYDHREGGCTWQEVRGVCDEFIEDHKAQCGMHPKMLAQVYFLNGWAHNKSLGSNEDNEQAKRSFEQALDILNRCEILSPESLFMKADILHQEGISQQRSKKYDFALESLNEALKIREELNDIVAIAFTKFQIFLVNEDMGKYKEGY
jgi:tetratricopeptide (TPR) repeat protein